MKVQQVVLFWGKSDEHLFFGENKRNNSNRKQNGKIVTELLLNVLTLSKARRKKEKKTYYERFEIYKRNWIEFMSFHFLLILFFFIFRIELLVSTFICIFSTSILEAGWNDACALWIKIANSVFSLCLSSSVSINEQRERYDFVLYIITLEAVRLEWLATSSPVCVSIDWLHCWCSGTGAVYFKK